MLTFNKLNRLPNINDAEGLYAVYNSKDYDGIYVVSDTEVICLCNPEKWQLPTYGNVTHPRFNSGASTTDDFNLSWLPTCRRLTTGGVDGIGDSDYPQWNIGCNCWGKSSNGITTSVNFSCGLQSGSLAVVILTPAQTYYYNEGRAVLLCRPVTDIERTYVDGTIIPNIYSDYENSYYSGVKINDKIWLREVLRTSHYANGDAIPSTLNDVEWSTTTSGACSFYNGPLTGLISTDDKIKAYGRCYNRYALYDPRNIVITNNMGWTIAYDTDFNSLINYLSTKYNTSVNNLRLKMLSTRQLNNTYTPNIIIPYKTNLISSSIIN